MLESKCAGSKDTRDGSFVVTRILQHFTLFPLFAFSFPVKSPMQVHLNMRSCSSCFYSAVPLTKPMPRQDDDTASLASETIQAVHNAGPGASSRSGREDNAKRRSY